MLTPSVSAPGSSDFNMFNGNTTKEVRMFSRAASRYPHITKNLSSELLPTSETLIEEHKTDPSYAMSFQQDN